MKAYHGTTEAIARKILREGIKPRALTGKNNWENGCESNPDLVYLSSCYAPYFACQACAHEKKERNKIGIIEIETENLDEKDFRPDEDFVEQATRGSRFANLKIKGKRIDTRTRWIRDHIDQFRHIWHLSNEKLGTFSHKGSIPPQAITAIAICDIKASRLMSLTAWDPTITTINKYLYSTKYTCLTRWCMGDKIPAKEWQTASALLGIPQEITTQINKWQKEQLCINQTCVEKIK